MTKYNVRPLVAQEIEISTGTIVSATWCRYFISITLHQCYIEATWKTRPKSNLDGHKETFNSGQDPHLAIAATKYHVPYEEALKIYEDENHPDHKIWKVRRKQAKQIAFGLIYGIGAKLLAVKLSDPKSGIIVTPEEAQELYRYL